MAGRKKSIAADSQTKGRDRKQKALSPPAEINYSRVLENIGDVVVIIDAKGINRFKSPNIQKLFGWRPEEVVGHPALNNVHPDDVPRAQAFIGSLLQESRVSKKTECRYRCKDGRYKWIEFAGINLLDDPGIGGILGNFRDITEYKQTESVLVDERERLKTIIETAGDPIFVKNNEHRIVLANHAFYELFGLDEPSVLGKTLAETVPDNEKNQFLAVDRLVLDTGLPDEREESLTVNGKPTKHVITRKRRFVDQLGNRLLVGSIHDVTAHKQAEDTIVAARNALQRVFDLVPDMICTASTSGRFLDVNPAFSRVLGHSREYLLCAPFFDLIHPDDLAATVDVIQKLLDGKPATNFVNRYRCQDGAYKVLEWFAAPCTDGILYAAARDITERQQVEETRQQFAQELLRVREEEKKSLSGILHHDIGSLTIGVLSRCDALEEDLRAGKTRNALKWLKQIKHLFSESMAHFKQIAIDVRPPELDVIGLRAALRQYFARTAEIAGISIAFSHNLGRRCVQGPATTILFRVAQEAVTNAVKHGQATKVKVRLTTSDAELLFMIRDNGKGFSVELPQKNTAAGMGLIVMRETVAAAGGFFTIDSKPGKGATIKMRLPLRGDMLELTEMAKPSQPVRSRKGVRTPIR